MASTSNDEQLIREVVQLYFTGTYRGREEELERAFRPDAHIVGHINGTVQDWTFKDFIERVTAKPTAEEKGEKLEKEILFVDITNGAAMVKTRVIAGGYTFIDYISLLKVDGKWAIGHKIFTT